MSTLELAKRAFQEGDREAGLAHLLARWRETGHNPAIGDAIDAIGAHLSQAEPPIRGSGTVSDVKAWTKALGDPRPSTLTRLLESLPKTTGLTAKARLAALAEVPTDPRLTTAIMGWMRVPPFDGKNRARCFPIAMAILERTRDVRALPLLRELGDPSHRAATVAALGLASVKPLRSALQAIEKATPGTLDAEELTLLDAAQRLALHQGVAAAPTSTEPAELFARIAHEPADVGLRLVLADLLQANSDPRGELIALQCARETSGAAPSARERRLLATHERAWLGAIEPFVLKSGVEFRRGFVSACRLTDKTPDASLPEWATVERLDVGRFAMYVGGELTFLRSAAWRSLRELTGASASALAAFAEEGFPRPLESVGFAVWSLNPIEVENIARLTRLPALRSLTLQERHGAELSRDRVAAILHATAQLPLHDLRLLFGWLDFGHAVSIAAGSGLQHLRLELNGGNRVSWEARARALELRLSSPPIDWAPTCIRSLAPGFVETVRVFVGKDEAESTRGDTERLARVVEERGARLEIVR